MKLRTIVGMLLVCCASAAFATAAQRAPAATCDRECLRGKVTQLLYALVKHDVKGLPVAGAVYDHSYLPRDRCIRSYDFSFSRQNSSIRSVSSSMT